MLYIISLMGLINTLIIIRFDQRSQVFRSGIDWHDLNFLNKYTEFFTKETM